MKPYVTVEEAIGDLPPLEAGKRSEIHNHKAPRASESVKERIQSADQGGLLYESYETNQRLNSTEPSPTILGKDWKYAHYDQCRGLTVRERARIQTFDDNIEFTGGVAQQRQQVANAVPPKLAESIGEVLEV